MSETTKNSIAPTVAEKAAEKHALKAELLSCEVNDGEYQTLLTRQAKQKATRNARAKLATVHITEQAKLSATLAKASLVASLTADQQNALCNLATFDAMVKSAAKSAVKTAESAQKATETETETTDPMFSETETEATEATENTAS